MNIQGRVVRAADFLNREYYPDQLHRHVNYRLSESPILGHSPGFGYRSGTEQITESLLLHRLFRTDSSRRRSTILDGPCAQRVHHTRVSHIHGELRGGPRCAIDFPKGFQHKHGGFVKRPAPTSTECLTPRDANHEQVDEGHFSPGPGHWPGPRPFSERHSFGMRPARKQRHTFR